jgi:hypothetical protein
MIKLRFCQYITTLCILVFGIQTLNAQVVDYVYDIPDLYCDGVVVRTDTFGPVLPSGMFLYRNDTGIPAAGAGMNAGWQLVEDVAVAGNYYLSATSWYVPALEADNRLVIELDLPASPICLSFKSWSLDMDYPENLEVWLFGSDVSHQDMLSGTLLARYDSLSAARSNKTIDLSAFSGQKVRLGFRHITKNGFKIGLDDIRITSVEQRDYVMVSAGFQYKSTIGDTMDVLFRIANKGSNPLVHAQIFWSIQPAGIQDSMMYSGDTLRMNTSALIQIPSVWIPSSTGIYDLCVHISELSQPPFNDTICVSDTVEFSLHQAQEASVGGIQLYPIPADSYFQIPAAGQWQVFTSQGVLIASGQNLESHIYVSTIDWANGIYFLHLQTENSKHFVKFSVHHR